MKPANQPQAKAKYDYGTALLMAVLLVTASQATEIETLPLFLFYSNQRRNLILKCRAQQKTVVLGILAN